MFSLVITEKGGSQRRLEFDKDEVTIGRVQGNDIILPKGNVSKRHSRIVLKDQRFIVVDLKSTNGTYVNGRRITTPLVVKPGDKVYIGDFIISVDPLSENSAPEPMASPHAMEPPTPPPLSPPGKDYQPDMPSVRPPPLEAPRPEAPQPSAPMLGGPMLGQPQFAQPTSPPPLNGPSAVNSPSASHQAPPSPSFGEPPAMQPPAMQPPPPQAAPVHTQPAQAAPAQAQFVQAQPAHAQPPVQAPPVQAPPVQAQPVQSQPLPPEPTPIPTGAPARDLSTPSLGAPVAAIASSPQGSSALAAVMHSVLAHQPQLFSEHASADPGWIKLVTQAVDAAIAQLSAAGTPIDAHLKAQALREATGLGPLEALLADDSIDAILVDSPSQIWIDRGAGLTPHGEEFSSTRMLTIIAKRLTGGGDGPVLHGPVQGRRLATVLLPPIANGGPTIEILRGTSAGDLSEAGAATHEAAAVVQRALQSKRRIAVVGAGAGAVDVVGACAAPLDGRIIAIDLAQPLQGSSVSYLSSGGAPFAQVALTAARLRSDHLVIDGVTVDELRAAFSALSAHGGAGVVGVRMTARGDATEQLSEIATASLTSSAVQLVIALGPDAKVKSIVEITGAPGGRLSSTSLFVDQGAGLMTVGQPTF